MGEYITIGEGLMISLFSIVAVFLVLLILSYLIDLLSAVLNKGEKKIPEKKKSGVQPVSETVIEPAVEDEMDDEELVAVISAAVAASMGVSIPEVNIRKIKRTSSINSSWSEMGRVEHISGKL